MVDRPDHPVLTLRNNQIIGWVFFVVLVGTGVSIMISSVITWRGPVVILLSAVLIVPGIWALPAMTRPWRFDSWGVTRGRRRVVAWSDVTEFRIDDVRPLGSGLGPARVRIQIHSRYDIVDITVYSYRNATELSGLLDAMLAPDVEGRGELPRICQAWEHLR